MAEEASQNLKISILIPSLGENTLQAVLESIRIQNCPNWETIVVDSSGKNHVSEATDKFDVKTIKTTGDVGLLQAKDIANQQATGDFCLFLDATKTLKPHALTSLSKLSSRFDMVLMFEERVGTGKWTKLAKLDKSILLNNLNLYRDGELADFLVPRFYKKSLVDLSLKNLKMKMPEDLFNRVLWPEDRLIFLEAKKLGGSLGIARAPLINHIGEDTFLSVIRKYHRYGKSYSDLRKFKEYSGQINSSRVRSMSQVNLQQKIGLYQLYFARFISFEFGYYLG
jgi:glycosyltransferase involved in cell wall biosynthesis